MGGDLMEKNKSVYKLKGLPPVYYLNLDEQPERKEYMENQFKYWGIENYTRVSAYDGRDGRDLGDILKGKYPDGMSSSEVGCTTSHLKLMKEFLETSDAPCALVMEDDCDISTVSHWDFTWKDFYSKVPYDYAVHRSGEGSLGDPRPQQRVRHPRQRSRWWTHWPVRRHQARCSPRPVRTVCRQPQAAEDGRSPQPRPPCQGTPQVRPQESP